MTTIRSDATAGLIIDSDTSGNITFVTGESNVAMTISSGILNISSPRLVVPVGNTSTRSNVLGTMRFNTTLGAFEGYNGTSWNGLSIGLPGEEIFATVLAVGGGGGGGGYNSPPIKGGGGGGAGGLFYSTNVPLRKDTDYFFSVGGGGAGAFNPTEPAASYSEGVGPGSSGSNTYLLTTQTYSTSGLSNLESMVVFCGGGGGGGSGWVPASSEGISVIAGSGGGGGSQGTPVSGGTGANLVYPYGTVIGYPGGAGVENSPPGAVVGAGGGGAGGAGGPGGPSPSASGVSGPGISLNIGTGSVTYAAGGRGKIPMASPGIGTGSGGGGAYAPGSTTAISGESGALILKLPNTLVLSPNTEFTSAVEYGTEYNTYVLSGSSIFKIISA